MSDHMQGTPFTHRETFTVAGVPADPTAITYYLRSPAPDNELLTYVYGVDAEVTNPSVGVYDLALDGTQAPGHWNGRIEGTGAVEAVNEFDFDILPSPTLTLVEQGVEFGPCTAWIDSVDVAECCNAEVGTDPCVYDAAALAASQILFEQSGRIYAGTCEKTVRPCGEGGWCGLQVLSRGYVVGWNRWWGSWGWWQDGNWTNACGCEPLSKIKLSGYPVTAITQVKIDGVVVDPATYRLDEHRWLVRTRETADDAVAVWPTCQNLDLPDTQEGTFAVTYQYGTPPPLIGQEAAKQLACQIYLACTGSDECQLPSGATRITRQGITIERQFFARDKATGSWRTGLTLVDTFLNMVNPGGVRRRPVTWSPDGHRYARSVGS